MLVPCAPNELVQFTDGRRFRILAIIDDCTRECLALVGFGILRFGRLGERLVVRRLRTPLT